jgi:hypothetical protein
MVHQSYRRMASEVVFLSLLSLLFAGNSAPKSRLYPWAALLDEKCGSPPNWNVLARGRPMSACSHGFKNRSLPACVVNDNLWLHDGR